MSTTPFPSSVWAIYVIGYGSFLFVGTEAEAEDMRLHKARWEGGLGRKRFATTVEIAAGRASSNRDDYWIPAPSRT